MHRLGDTRRGAVARAQPQHVVVSGESGLNRISGLCRVLEDGNVSAIFIEVSVMGGEHEGRCGGKMSRGERPEGLVGGDVIGRLELVPHFFPPQIVTDRNQSKDYEYIFPLRLS